MKGDWDQKGQGKALPILQPEMVGEPESAEHGGKKGQERGLREAVEAYKTGKEGERKEEAEKNDSLGNLLRGRRRSLHVTVTP